MQSNSPFARKQRFLSNFFALLISASLLLTSFAAVPAPRAWQTGAAPATTAPDPARVNIHQIVYKLKASDQVSALATLPAVQGLDAQPLFTTPLPVLKAAAAAVSAQAINRLPRLDLYYRVQLAPETTPADAQKVLDGIKADPTVELAYFEPVYLPASVNMIATDYTDSQGYLQSAADANGIDALYAWQQAGGRGSEVQVIDIEGGWQIGHEDLSITSGSLIESNNSSDRTWVDHGTAVLGVIAAKNNSIGVTGIASNAYVRMVSTLNFATANAIIKAAANLTAGDVIVIPLQVLGPTSGQTSSCSNFEAVPVEYTQAVFDAIYTATQLGIIVVEAAGDGGMNLDDTRYNDLFKRSNRDSGAILVGAGDSSTREPIPCTNFGKRVDMQGWGNNVYSTGYGDLEPGTVGPDSDPNQFYTASFGGTSAAAAIVAGASASLQGVAKARGYTLTPDLVRSILRSTGQTQGGDLNDPTTPLIGPLPDLHAAITKKITSGVQQVSPANGETVNTLRPTFTWQSYLGATQYELLISDRANFSNIVKDVTQSGTEYTPGDNLGNKTYYWKVRAQLSDVWQNWPVDPWTVYIKASTAPGITLKSPDNGFVSADYSNQTFSWNKPSTNYAGGYQFEISIYYDFSDYDFINKSPEEVSDPNGNVDYWPAYPLEQNTRYYWRVRSMVTDSSSNVSVGPWSARRVLYTGLDVSSASAQIAANADTLRPTFDWSDVPNARGYQIVASFSDQYTSPILNATINIPSGTTDPSPYSQFKPGSDLPRGAKTIYWRVRARGQYGWSAWVIGDSFDQSNPPPAPSPVSPGDRTVFGAWQTGVTFSWKGPSKTGQQPTGGYQLEISTTKDFSDNIIDTPTAAQGVLSVKSVVAYDPETVYYWHVRALGDSGTSNWSATRTFYTTPPAPTNPAVVGAVDSLRPVLTWTPVSIARSYQVQVYRVTTTGATQIVATVSTSVNPPFTLTATLPRSQDLFWRVRAGGLYGYSDWSAAVPITTPNPPTVPGIASPVDGANLSTFTPTLDWNPSSTSTTNPDANPDHYQIQVSTSKNFEAANLVVNEQDVPSDTTKYVVKDSDLTNADTYYWRVRAVNANTEYSLWSTVRQFTTPAQVKGKIINALTGASLENVLVQVSGRALQVNTDAQGNYTIRGLLPGSYSLSGSLSGYGRQQVSFTVGYGTNLTRDFQLVSFPADNQIRIVLYWNGTPSDMNAHLWLPPTHAFHIYNNAAHLGSLTNAAIQAQLDLGNANGYGPEVITIGGYFTGVYNFAVYQYGDADKFVNTGARVYVYQGNTLKANIPITTESGVGHWWKVFTLNVKSISGSTPTYDLKIQNQITDQDPTPANYPAP